MLIWKKKKDSVHPWKPVAFVDIPIKTTSRVNASSQANKQIYFWVIIITLQVVNVVSMMLHAKWLTARDVELAFRNALPEVLFVFEIN